MLHNSVPTFGHLMCMLGERVVDTWRDEYGVLRSKMTLEECRIQCDFWADEYPSLAEDLRIVAMQYGRLMTRERPVTMREPGEDRLEDI